MTKDWIRFDDSAIAKSRSELALLRRAQYFELDPFTRERTSYESKVSTLTTREKIFKFTLIQTIRMVTLSAMD